MSTTPSGRRAAAVALVALGPERAAAVLRSLDESEVSLLMAEVSALGPVQPQEVVTTLQRLNTELVSPSQLPAPGKRFAKDLLVRALGPERGAALGAELDVTPPFAWLGDGDPVILARALASEPPGALALALAHLDPATGSRLLTALPEPLQHRVAARVAALGSVHPDTVRQVEETMRRKVADLVATDLRPVQGPQLLAGLLAKAGRDTTKQLLEAIAASDPALAEATRDALFTFDDALALPTRALQVLLRAVDGRQLATALHGLPEPTVSTVLENLSERARESVVEERDLLTDVSQKDVAAARAAVVAAARSLEEEGALVLSPDSEAA